MSDGASTVDELMGLTLYKSSLMCSFLCSMKCFVSCDHYQSELERVCVCDMVLKTCVMELSISSILFTSVMCADCPESPFVFFQTSHIARSASMKRSSIFALQFSLAS